MQFTNFTRRAALAFAMATAISGALPGKLYASAEHGGDLIATLDIEIASLDPLFGSAVGYDRTTLNLFYENLFILDADGNFEGRLASDWQLADDKLSMTFNLQKGVTFSDGTPFNAEAVKANIDRIVSDREASRATTLASAIAGADVVDEHTVRINFGRQSGSVLSVLATEAGMMVSPKALADPEALRRNPVGTGPFILEGWQGGFELSATRNTNYWRTDDEGNQLPYLDSITFKFISDTSVAIVEAQSGSVHIADRIQARDFERVQAMDGLTLNPRPSQITQALVFNNSAEPFGDNLKLRQAVVAAIDPERVEKVVSNGLGRANPTWVPNTSWEYTQDLPTPVYDVEKARTLFEESGHEGPLTLSIIQRDPDTQVAQIVQAMLAQAGITLDIEVLEREAWLDKTRGRRHELAQLRSTAPLADPDIRFSGYYLPDSGGNYSAIQDDVLIEMVKKAEAETDFAVRKQVYADIQKRLLENAYEVYLFARPAAEIIRDEVKGFKTELVDSWLLDEVYLEQ